MYGEGAGAFLTDLDIGRREAIRYRVQHNY